MLNNSTYRIIFLHSTAYYLIAYLFMLVIFQSGTVLSARFFDIPAIVYYNKIDFLVNTRSWNFDSVKTVFASGPVICLIFGLICLVIFLRANSYEGLLKLFFFWGFVHGTGIFIGSIMIGAFIYEGMGYVFAWMYLSETMKMFLLFLGISILIAAGTFLMKPMLISGNSYFNTCKPHDRVKFKFYQFIFPCFTGMILLILIRIPISIYEALILLVPSFLLLPLFSKHHAGTLFYFDEKERQIGLRWKLIMTVTGILLLFRLGLSIGIRIG